MTRFVRSVAACFVAVVVLGGLVVALSGSVVAPGATETGEAVGLAQVEDDTTSGGEASVDTASLTPIERLLAQLAPSTGATTLPVAQRVVLSRDPFAPVVVETTSDGTDGDGADGDGTDGDGADGDGTDGDGTDGGGTDGGGTDGGGTDGGDACTGDEQEAVCDGVVVTLDGFTDAGLAIVSVDGTSFTVSVGDEFATSFRVLAVNDPCVTLLFGDEAFSICEGATVLK